MIPTPSNIPSVEFNNLFLSDPVGGAFWTWWLGRGNFSDVRGHFVSLGEAGAMATPFSARADLAGPVLQTHSPAGDRIDRVDQHPDYRELQRLSYGRKIIGLKYDPVFLAKHRDIRHLVGFGAGYYFAQTEIGLYCPICMTDGLGRVLERHAQGPIAAETLRHLAATDLEQLWQGAMFLTERQGGSDVGSNTVIARQEGQRWLLTGDKWFCSNVAADAILALARMPGGPEGTKGLGLFLVLRKKPEANSATIRIHRIKPKLGVRSMPTGEITFENTEATLIGGIGEGFKQMAEMLNLSRLYNSVASVAGMRRAIMEAVAYGSGRKAFGEALQDLPLWRSAMADLVAEHLGIFALVFETVRQLDRADGGDEGARRFVRLAIPMAKALSGKLSVFAVSEAMEAIGGNAYIEESILPRLLRDCQVLPIWEGTTHILTLDAIRAIRKERSHEVFLWRVDEALSKVHGLVAEVETVRKRLDEDKKALQQVTQLPEELRQREARSLLESLGRTMTLALLLEASSEPSLHEVAVAAFRRLNRRPFSVMPVCQKGVSEQVDTESVLLHSVLGQGASP